MKLHTISRQWSRFMATLSLLILLPVHSFAQDPQFSDNYLTITGPIDTTNCDSVRLRFRDRDGRMIGNIHRIRENFIFKISGLPFPLNLLNGGEIAFPEGSLSEDITIDITLPETAIVHGDTTVSFIDEILTGISFHVYVNDTLVAPYYFQSPVQITLPYKVGHINNLGLTPDDLWVFFYADSAAFDTTGIYNVVVDSSRHKIYVEVIHFSDIVVAGKHKIISTGIRDAGQPPEEFRLYSNYPNPFNPETALQYEVNGTVSQRIALCIYNMLGQKIRTLFAGELPPGSYTAHWNGRDDTGQPLGSGIYIYQLAGEGVVLTGKMTLIR